MIPIEKTVAIDEEGFFLFGDTRVSDMEIGAELIRNLKFSTNNAIVTALPLGTGSEEYIVEAFSEPLVIQSVELKNTGSPMLWGTLPYDVQIPLPLNEVTVDEWDRFHGYESIQKIPWVLSRKAQNQLFELVDEFDDDSITIAEKKYETPPYWGTRKDVEKDSYWSAIYKEKASEGKTAGWDMGQPHPVFQEMLPKLKLSRARVLVLGCGFAHDASLFAEAGHLVTAVDFSEEALKEAQNKYGHLSNLKFQKADVFNLPSEWFGEFDLIVEHTLFCAINPQMRPHLINVWKRCLVSGGNLMGVFFAMERKNATPFGSTEWEIRERLKKDFQFLYWARWKKSINGREGKELFIYAQKK